MTRVVVLSADTFGTARAALANLPAAVQVVRRGTDKRRYVASLGRDTVAAIGNGTNDVQLLREAALGIAVLGDEGTSAELLDVATVVVREINVAFDLLLKPKRLVATLRR
jgi:P-type E1-E2 ATPase